MLIFGATVNVVPWVYGPEILPLEARSRGTAISVSAHWTWNFCKQALKLSWAPWANTVLVIVMMTPILINRIHWRTYIIFTITNVCLRVPTIQYCAILHTDLHHRQSLYLSCISSIQKHQTSRLRISTRFSRYDLNLSGKRKMWYIRFLPRYRTWMIRLLHISSEYQRLNMRRA